MHTLEQIFLDRPVWQQQARRRLAVNMGVAVLLLAGLLLLVKFSPLPVPPLKKIELRLLADIEPPAVEPAEPEDQVEPEPIEPIEAIEPIERVEPTEVTAPTELVESAESPVTDWYADVESAVQETVTTANHVDSMHAAFDEKRRLAAINFPASQAPVKKPIWENVETDQMGRKILVSGDCYRVLEDWRVTYYDIQRDFGQFITYCNANTEKPIGVAWVEDVRERYAYLKYPDGEIPQDLLSALTRQYRSSAQE